MEQQLLFAFATDDKKNFSQEHFGEANEYLIYEITKNNSKLINTVKNISPEEKMHGDPNKAKGITSILKPFGVKVLVNKAFGRNIVRQQQKFVCIISKENSIENQIKKIQSNLNDIINEWNKGESRGYLKF